METSPLRSRNFTLLIAGQAISLIASTTLRFALSMWVLDETGSATTFAAILSLSFIPTLLLSPFGGVLADRINRKAIMVGLDVTNAMLVLLATVTFLALGTAQSGTLTHYILGYSSPIVASLLILLSVLSAFETPTVQAVLPQLLKKHGETVLRQGSGITMQVQQLCSLLPTMLGGFMYAAVGAAPMLTVSIVCFAAAAAIETQLKLGDVSAQNSGTQSNQLQKVHPIADIREAIAFLTQQKPHIFELILFSTLFNLLVMGYSAVGLPYLIRTHLRLSATLFGINEGLASISGLIGAAIASKIAAKLNMRFMPVTVYTIAGALCIAGIAFVYAPPLSNIAVYAVVAASTCVMAMAASFSNVIAIPAIQQHTTETLTGRVMALVSSFSIAAQPVGQLLYGWMFDNVRVSWVILGSAAALAAAGFSAAPLCHNAVWNTVSAENM